MFQFVLSVIIEGFEIIITFYISPDQVERDLTRSFIPNKPSESKINKIKLFRAIKKHPKL